MSNWAVPEPRWLIRELDDEYRAEPYTPEPGGREVMEHSTILERLEESKVRELREFMSGIGEPQQ